MTLKARLRDKDRQRFFVTFLGGKMMGIVLAAGIILGPGKFILGTTVHALAPQADVPIQDVVNGTNTAWTLIAAFLVFFMQAGFMMLEAGFARTREVVNILQECIVDTCLCALLFWAFGFAFMFGFGNGVIGHEFFFLNGAPATYTYHGVFDTGVAFQAFFLFQFAFADTCSTITSGAMVGRTGFKGDLLYSIGVSGFIYPILGHWVWGPGGWLQTARNGVWLHDFAGSTVVHTMGGMIALAGAIVLGPRLGRKFKRDGGGLPPGHDMTVAAIGGVILWFGWYGFNPGSTLSAIDSAGIGRVATNTTLAAAAAGLTAMAWVYPRVKKWDIGITINGFLGGLVAITCPCYWVNATGAVIIGAIAGPVVVLGIDLIEHLRIDDPIGAVAVHGIAGIWGTWSLGLFSTGQFGVPKGLLWGGGGKQLFAQVWGNAVIAVASFGVAYIVMRAVKLTGTLRVSEEGELEGLDIHEHGAPAYHPEAAYMGKGL
ncbi:MAG TPA: ammonium transporter [Ilumatobacteraceae bacterium]|nr:ammonium transporter [Ilumatobacteraceae bacterium]